jgi:multimeric flavodoxin WrbA
VRERILPSEILIVASPTWLGRPSSVAQRALERMDAMLSETDEEGRPVAYNRVAGVVVTATRTALTT